MLDNLDLYGMLKTFDDQYKVAEVMIQSFVKAGATKEEASAIVEGIFKKSIKNNKDLFKTLSLEQARKNK